MVRTIVTAILDDLGYHVLKAAGGDAALELAGAWESEIDLVLTDLVMPGLSGRETAARVRERFPVAKVLYMSGYTDDIAIRGGALEPATAFIQKPFSATELARAVRDALALEPRERDLAQLSIADDHPPVLRSISQLVREWGYAVVATTGDGTAALEKVRELKPDIALVDLHMPGTSGIEIAQEASRTGATAVLIYTGIADQAYLTEALDAGARGFVLKEAPLDDLRRALGVVIAGGTYVDPVVNSHLIGHAAAPQLTKREREALRCLGEGCSNAEIGERLFISHETVRTHVAKATRKLGARTRTEAVVIAFRAGLIT